MTAADNENYFSFGRYLQSCRQKKNIDLEVLSRYLRINIDILRAIESEDFSRMPDSVYARGFLRSFAEAVGADGDRVVRNYMDSMAMLRKIEAAESRIAREEALFGRKALLSLTVLALLMVATALTLDRPELAEKNRQVPETGVTPATARKKEPPVKKLSSGSQANVSEAVPVAEENSETILLTIDTLEETWLKIIIDNQKPNEYTLQPGDHLELGALSRFNLLIGNAAGVKLFVNGKPMPVPGGRSEVVNLEIP